MRFLRIFIALSLVLGLGYSQCTGGLTGLSHVIAAAIGESTGMKEVAMSLAPIECSSAENMSTNHEEAAESGCRDGESCLTQLAQSAAKQVAMEEILMGRVHEVFSSFILIVTSANHEQGSKEIAIRSGPLYESALLAAHITVKRE